MTKIPAQADGRDIVDAAVAAVRSVLGEPEGVIALHEPQFDGHEWIYAKECLDTGWVSSVGSYVDRFERDLAAITGVHHVAATMNGTAALHTCLLLAGVVRGDEVLMPALTFIATANAASYIGAVPHFVDSEEHSLGIDAARLEKHLSEIARVETDTCINRRTGATIRALVAMHVFGHPSNVEALAEVAARWHLVFVEDAAESLGSTFGGRQTGQFGRVSALSFNGNKIATTGGGGAVLTNDPALGRRAKHLTTTARTPHRWSFLHDEVGFNYRLPNINAAIGCAQLEKLPRVVEEKRELAKAYAAALKNVAGLRFQSEPSGTRSNYWLNAIVLEQDHAARRDDLLEALNSAGYQARPVWTLMHRLPMYENCPRDDLRVAERLEAAIVNVPSSPFLSKRALP